MKPLARLAMVGASTVVLGMASIPSASAFSGVELPPTTQCSTVQVDGKDLACVTLSSSRLPYGDPTVTVQVTSPYLGYSTGPIPVVAPLSAVSNAVDPYVTLVKQSLCDSGSSGETHVVSIGSLEVKYTDPNVVAIAVGVGDQVACTGVFVGLPSGTPSVSPDGGAVLVSHSVHIPQVCQATTGTCVGPFDRTITVDPSIQGGGLCLGLITDGVSTCLVTL